jgi:hypothetical protein
LDKCAVYAIEDGVVLFVLVPRTEVKCVTAITTDKSTFCIARV